MIMLKLRDRLPDSSGPLLKRHHSITEGLVSISPPHCSESLQKCEAISALGHGERPERWTLNQRPGNIPRHGEQE
jgi:hypothetical protein